MRRLAAVLSLAGLLAVAFGFASGFLSLVVTHGNSMAPRMATGDLVIVYQSSYAVGDVVAYHSKDLEQVVLHRVLGIDGGRYSFQGDHNGFVDPEEPVFEQLIGKELVHIPQGGVWLDRLTSPTALGLVAFGLLATGGTAVQTRRTRRRRTVSQHLARSRHSGRSMTGLPPWATTTAATVAVVGVLGVALGAAAWTASTAPITPGLKASDNDSNQAMTFSYTAEVPKSPAYDDTTVTAPLPIFRKLTDDVEVEYSYRGDPGTVSVAAELSTASGWHSSVPLSPLDTLSEDSRTGTVSLDLNALEGRAAAAATVTGIPADQVNVAVVPTVTTSGDKKFAPELAFVLTPLQLTLAGEESSLTVGDETPAITDAPATAPTLSLAGRELPVSTGRLLSVLMVLAALLAAVVLGLVARLSAPATESAAIHRRYAQMLVKVEPMPTPSGRPVIDVVDFATLAKLAQRYELLILHWVRSDVETFVVQDQGTTYRYRTGTGASHVMVDDAVETI